jgi:hypothetical protein
MLTSQFNNIMNLKKILRLKYICVTLRMYVNNTLVYRVFKYTFLYFRMLISRKYMKTCTCEI